MSELKIICSKCGYIHRFDSDIIEDLLQHRGLSGILAPWDKSENTGWVLLFYNDLAKYDNLQDAVSEMIVSPDDYLYLVSIYSEGLFMKCPMCGTKIPIEVKREYTIHAGHREDMESAANVSQLCESTEYVDSCKNVSLYILSHE